MCIWLFIWLWIWLCIGKLRQNIANIYSTFIWSFYKIFEFQINKILKSKYRLFIYNDHVSYINIKIIEFCIDNNIIFLYFLAHITHIFQLLNINFFQFLTIAYQKYLNENSRLKNNYIINKYDFFKLIYLTKKNAIIERKKIIYITKKWFIFRLNWFNWIIVNNSITNCIREIKIQNIRIIENTIFYYNNHNF